MNGGRSSLIAVLRRIVCGARGHRWVDWVFFDPGKPRLTENREDFVYTADRCERCGAVDNAGRELIIR